MVRQRSLVSAAWEYFKVVQGGAQCQIEGCSHTFLKRASGSSTKFLWSHLDAHHRELAKELGRLGKKRVRKNQCKKIGPEEKMEINRLVSEKLANGIVKNLNKDLRSNEPKVIHSDYGITNFIEQLNAANNESGGYLIEDPNKKSLPVANPNNTETVDIHCYPSGSSQIQSNFVYTQSNIPSNSSNTMNMNLMDLINGGPETSNVSNMNTPIPEPQQAVLSVNEYFCKMLCAQLNQLNEKQAHLAREKIHSIIGQFLFNDQQTSQQMPPAPPKHHHQQFNQPYS